MSQAFWKIKFKKIENLKQFAEGNLKIVKGLKFALKICKKS